VSLDKITVSLEAAKLAASVLARLSPLADDFPAVRPVMVKSNALLNAALDQVAEELVAVLPEDFRPPPPKWRTNGHDRGQKSEIRLLEAPESPAEPETPSTPAEPAESAWEPSSERTVSRCKALLLEVLRRAAHDWVLYRQHRKMGMRDLANDAYIWLFEEDEGHPYHKERQSAVFPDGEGDLTGARAMTSFLAICEALELDPEVVRTRVRKMDARSIISSGRPPQTRRAPPRDGEVGVEHVLQVDVDLEPESDGDNHVSHYESYGSVMTPSQLFYG
jgi:hypothetical protein